MFLFSEPVKLLPLLFMQYNDADCERLRLSVCHPLLKCLDLSLIELNGSGVSRPRPRTLPDARRPLPRYCSLPRCSGVRVFMQHAGAIMPELYLGGGAEGQNSAENVICIRRICALFVWFVSRVWTFKIPESCYNWYCTYLSFGACMPMLVSSSALFVFSSIFMCASILLSRFVWQNQLTWTTFVQSTWPDPYKTHMTRMT